MNTKKNGIKITSKKQQGIALISILAIFSVVITMISIVSNEIKINSKKATIYLTRIQEKQNAFAAERYILANLDSKKNKGLSSAQIIDDVKNINLGVVTKAIDENSLFNLNWLLRPVTGDIKSQTYEYATAVLRNILSSLSIDISMVEKLVEIVNSQSRIRLDGKNKTQQEKHNPQEILNISCINLLTDLSLDEKQKLSSLVTVLPKESQLNINTANEYILTAIGNLFGIDFNEIIQSRDSRVFKSINELQPFFIDQSDVNAINNLKHLPLGFNSNFISLYIKSTKDDFSFFLKSLVFHSKGSKPKVVARELGMNYQWPLFNKE